jgi:hypothetical protein
VLEREKNFVKIPIEWQLKPKEFLRKLLKIFLKEFKKVGKKK